MKITVVHLLKWQFDPVGLSMKEKIQLFSQLFSKTSCQDSSLLRVYLVPVYIWSSRGMTIKQFWFLDCFGRLLAKHSC